MKIATLALAGTALFTSCSSMGKDEPEPDFKTPYLAGDYAKASHEASRQIAEDAGVNVEEVLAAEAGGRAPAVTIDDTMALLFFEKAMLAMADGKPGLSLSLLEAAQGVFEEGYVDSMQEYFGNLESMIVGESLDDYHGADYEQVMAPVMLTLLNLVTDGRESYAYTHEIDRIQGNILGSDLGDGEYRPRQSYRRIVLGKYIEGLILENEFRPGDAKLAYADASSFSGGAHALVEEAVERIEDGTGALTAGEGVLHVFYLGGRGPRLEEQWMRPDVEIAIVLVRAVMALLYQDYTPLFQDTVPVPKVVVTDANVGPLQVSVPALGRATGTETLLDVNQVAAEQLEARIPMIIARAVIRRSIKTVLISELQEKIDGREAEIQAEKSQDQSLSGQFKGMFESSADPELLKWKALLAVWTAVEKADTRSWSTLPAEIQAARIPLPEGEHTIQLGDGTSHKVRIQSGRASFLAVVQPNLARPATLLVDEGSRVASEASAVSLQP